MPSFDANPHQPQQPEGPYGMMGQMGGPSAVDMMGSSPPQMPPNFGGGPLDGPHSLGDNGQHSRPFPVPLLSHSQPLFPLSPILSLNTALQHDSHEAICAAEDAPHQSASLSLSAVRSAAASFGMP